MPSLFKRLLIYYSPKRRIRYEYNLSRKRNIIRNKMLKKRSIRAVEYMDMLDILDEFEEKGVETIYQYFDKAYFLCYDCTSELGWRLDEIEW